MNGLSKGETSITSKHTTQEKNVCYRGNGDGRTIVLGICLDENLQPSSSTTSWVIPTHLLCITTWHVPCLIESSLHPSKVDSIIILWWQRRYLGQKDISLCSAEVDPTAGIQTQVHVAPKQKSVSPQGVWALMGNAMTGNKACTKAGKDFKS